jgi:hypothetical protein
MAWGSVAKPVPSPAGLGRQSRRPFVQELGERIDDQWHHGLALDGGELMSAATAGFKLIHTE